MAPTVSVTALIPNYNGRKLLTRYLPKVLNTLRTGDELMIVDDCSTDDSLEWLSKIYHARPQTHTKTWIVWKGDAINDNQDRVVVTIIQNLQNIRFGASSNRGVKLASGTLIFLLNSDVAPHPDALKHLLTHFGANPDESNVFGVGCLEIETAQNRAVAGKQKLWFERGIFMHAKADDFLFGETAWVTGGSGLFNRKKWLEIGGFDAAYYPAYWEDIDLSFQAKKLGYQVLFDPRAVVDHNHETTNTSVFGTEKIAQMSWKNCFHFTWKNSNWLQKLQFLIWQPYWWWQQLKQRYV